VNEEFAMNDDESVFEKFKADLRHYAEQERVPLNAAFVARMLLLTPGFQFVLSRRLQEALVNIPLVGRLLRRIVWWMSCIVFGAEIGLAAKVGGGLYVPHPYGIVVGICTVGRNVAIMQNVTIGRRRPTDDGAAVIGDGALLSVGSVVLGRNAIVAAKSVALSDVPDNAVAAGMPARVIAPKQVPQVAVA